MTEIEERALTAMRAGLRVALVCRKYTACIAKLRTLAEAEPEAVPFRSEMVLRYKGMGWIKFLTHDAAVHGLVFDMAIGEEGVPSGMIKRMRLTNRIT